MILDRAQVGKIDNADARGGSGSTYFFAGDSDDFVKNGQEHRRQTAEEGWLRDERVGSRRARIIKVSSLGLVLAGIGFFAVRQRLLKDRDESMRFASNRCADSSISGDPDERTVAGETAAEE
jgi:hypothetical protein